VWYTLLACAYIIFLITITARTISGVFEASVTTVLAAVVVHTASIQDASISIITSSKYNMAIVLPIGDCRGYFLETKMWV